MQIIYSKINEATQIFGYEIVKEVVELVEKEGDWITEHHLKDMQKAEHIKCFEFMYFNKAINYK